MNNFSPNNIMHRYIDYYNECNKKNLILLSILYDKNFEDDVILWCHSPETNDIEVTGDIFTTDKNGDIAAVRQKMVDSIVSGTNVCVVNTTRTELRRFERKLKLEKLL